MSLSLSLNKKAQGTVNYTRRWRIFLTLAEVKKPITQFLSISANCRDSFFTITTTTGCMWLSQWSNLPPTISHLLFPLSISRKPITLLINLGVEFSHLLGIIRRGGGSVGRSSWPDFCLEDQGRILKFYYHGGATVMVAPQPSSDLHLTPLTLG